MKPPSNIYSFLAGAWVLVNNTVTYTNGTSIPVSPQIGLLQYTANGYMAANIMSALPENRPINVHYPPRDTDSDADWALVGRYTMTYAGPYSVDVWNETHGHLTHGPLIYAGIQSWVGANQSRNYSVWEGGNVLRVGIRNPDTGATGDIFWRRGESMVQ